MRIYKNVSNRTETVEDEHDEEPAEFDDGNGDENFDEFQDDQICKEQDRITVYAVIQDAKNGDTSAFKDHFNDTKFFVPDDDSEVRNFYRMLEFRYLS